MNTESAKVILYNSERSPLRTRRTNPGPKPLFCVVCERGQKTNAESAIGRMTYGLGL